MPKWTKVRFLLYAVFVIDLMFTLPERIKAHTQKSKNQGVKSHARSSKPLQHQGRDRRNVHF